MGAGWLAMTIAPAAAGQARRIGDILLELGFASEEALAKATIEQEKTGQPLGQILVDLGLITDRDLVELLAEQLRMHVIDLGRFACDRSMLALLTKAEARRLAGNLEREAVPYACVFASLLGAAASQAAGDSSAAAAGLREGIERCDATGMRLFGASARLRLAGLVGGEEGRALRQAAEEVAAVEDIPRLDLYARTIVAGNWPDALPT